MNARVACILTRHIIPRRLSQEVYAQRLSWRRPGSGAGVLIVATEEDEVYALDARSGAEIWKRTLGEPVPRSALPCGNISRLGVTGAPVIDAARATLYLDAAVMSANGVHGLRGRRA